MNDPWLFLQLADGAFPSGAFAHSAGLEAAHALGGAPDAEAADGLVAAALRQAGRGGLPFVGAAHRAPGAIAQLAAELDALLTNHVANRASRAQGRAFAGACARVFPDEAVRAVDDLVRGRLVVPHHAPLFGALARALGLELRPTQALYLHGVLRGIVSAAVRLGLFGPHEAQARQRAHAATLDAVLAASGDLAPEDAAQTDPLLELFSAAHDRLDVRLFQS